MSAIEWMFLIALVVITVELRWLASKINAAAYNRNRDLLLKLQQIEDKIHAGLFGPKR